MKKFNFRLETILHWRNLELQRQKAKLTEMLHQEQQMAAEVRKLAAERLNSQTEIRGQASIDAADLRHLASYLVGSLARQQAAQERFRKFTGLVAQQRAAAAKAEREVKLVEKLKERRLREWTVETERELETVAQEVWTAVHQRGEKICESV